MGNTSKPAEDQQQHQQQQQQDGMSSSNPDPSNPNDEINSNDVVDADGDDKKWKNVNRIKIKIPLEQRRDGSISDIIAQKMLIQYDETKDKDEKDAFFSKHNVTAQLLDDDDDDDEDYDEEKEKEAEEPTKAPPANNIGASTLASSASPPPPTTTTNTSRGDNESAEGNTISRRMIHDLSLSKEIPLFRHQEGRRILPALELDTIKKLPPDTKIKVINRITGKVMESRVPVSQLPEMLAKDASLEPIIESSVDDYSSVADNNGTAQVARSNPRATISLGIRRQKRMKNRFTKGEIVSITEGPNAGSVASFQEYLTAGWARLKTIPQGPVLIVHKDFFVRIAEAKRKNKRRKVIPDLVNIISAGCTK